MKILNDNNYHFNKKTGHRRCFFHARPGRAQRSEKLIQNAVKLHPLLVWLYPIFLEEQRHPLRTEIVRDAARRQGQILVAIGDAQTAAIDKTRESLAFQHQVRQAGVPMGDDPVLRRWSIGLQLRPDLRRRPPLPGSIEGRFIHPSGLHATAGINQA